MNKLPYIPDKKMYAAVMGSCSWIKDTGFFNKATSYYAEKYSVDVEELRRYVRIAQSNGQKKANAKKPKREYFYYAIEYSIGSLDDIDYFVEEWAQFGVVKATSEENAKRHLCKNDSLYGGPQHYSRRIKKCETHDDAVKQCIEWKIEKEGKDD